MYPGGRVMFTAIDDRKLFLSDEDASEFEHALAEQGIGPADFMRVTKVEHGGRGGGFSIRVERIEDENDAREPEPRRDARLEGQLEKSIEMARETRSSRPAGASSKSSALPAPAARIPEAARVPIQAAPRSIHSNTTQEKTNGNEPACLPNGPTISTSAVAMCAAMCAAVDAVLETQAYATRRGLGVTFSEESVRAIGLRFSSQ